jgi:hypothetical protein
MDLLLWHGRGVGRSRFLPGFLSGNRATYFITRRGFYLPLARLAEGFFCGLRCSLRYACPLRTSGTSGVN